MDKKLIHICEVCGKTEILTPEETRNKTIVEDEDTLLSCAIDGMYLNSELFSHFRGSSNIG